MEKLRLLWLQRQCRRRACRWLYFEAILSYNSMANYFPASFSVCGVFFSFYYYFFPFFFGIYQSSGVNNGKFLRSRKERVEKKSFPWDKDSWGGAHDSISLVSYITKNLFIQVWYEFMHDLFAHILINTIMITFFIFRWLKHVCIIICSSSDSFFRFKRDLRGENDAFGAAMLLLTAPVLLWMYPLFLV